MRIEIADGPVHLAEDGNAPDSEALDLEARGNVGELLSDRRRRRGLPMRARQHSDFRIAVREPVQRAPQIFQHRQQQGLARVLQHQRVSEIIDILRSARKMHPFQFRRRRAACLQLGAQPNIRPP